MGELKALFVTLAILHGADAATTCMALARGAREANPVLPQSCAANATTKTVIAVGTMWLLAKIDDTHPTLARITGTVQIGVESYAVGHNVRLLVTLSGRR